MAKKEQTVTSIEPVPEKAKRREPGAISVDLPMTLTAECTAVAREMGETEIEIRRLVRYEAEQRLVGLSAREVYVESLRRKIAGLQETINRTSPPQNQG